MEEVILASTTDESDSATDAVLQTAAHRARAKRQAVTIFHNGRRLRVFPDGRTEDAGPEPSETSAQLAARSEMAKPEPAKFELRDLGIDPASRKNARTASLLRTDKRRAKRPPALGTLDQDNEKAGIGAANDAHISDPAGGTPSDKAEKAPNTDEVAATAASTTEYNLKVAAAACANAKNMLQLTGDLMRAKTLADMFEVSAAYARRQMEAGAEQVRDLAAAAQKIAPKNSDGTDK